VKVVFLKIIAFFLCFIAIFAAKLPITNIEFGLAGYLCIKIEDYANEQECINKVQVLRQAVV